VHAPEEGMTIQAYTGVLISEGHSVAQVRFTSFYPFNGVSFDVDQNTILFQIVTHDDESLCEFFDADGKLVARAKSFEGAV
jgi:hypothetical protein